MKKILIIATTLLCVLSASVQANNALSFSATTKQAGLTLDKISPNITLSFNTPTTTTSKSTALAMFFGKYQSLTEKKEAKEQKQKPAPIGLAVSKMKTEEDHFSFAPQPSVELPRWLILGLQAGINLPKYKFSSNFRDEFRTAGFGSVLSYSSEQKLSFQGGITVGYHNDSESFSFTVSPTFARQGGLYTSDNVTFNTKNSKGNDSTFLGFFRFDETVNTIQVPLLLKWRVIGSEDSRIGMTLGAGVSFNYSFQGNRNTTVESEVSTSPYDSEKLSFGKGRTDKYRALAVGAVIHSGIFIKLNDEGTKRLTFSTDWNIGLSNLQTDSRTQYLKAKGLETLGKKTQNIFIFQVGIQWWPDFF